MAPGSSSGRSMAREQSRAYTSQANAPTIGTDKGKGPEAEPSGSRTYVPPMLATRQGKGPVTVSDIKTLVEIINQKIDGVSTCK